MPGGFQLERSEQARPLDLTSPHPAQFPAVQPTLVLPEKRGAEEMARPRLRVDDDAEALVTAYCRFEMERRRLCELSVTNAAYNVRHFLAWRASVSRPPIALLDAEELHEYVLAEARRLSIGAMRAQVAVLRTFTRFLFVTGVTQSDLTGAVQSAPGCASTDCPRLWSRRLSRR
jgi:hypothetical protein